MDKKAFGMSKIKKSPDIPSLVAKQIIDRIAKGALKPGDKLPSEYEMTKLFGISRISLREAMKLLEARGYIESQNRRGKFVKSMVDDMRTPLKEVLSIGHERIWELLYVRRIIEAEAAYLSATHASREQIKQMRDLFKHSIKIDLDFILNTKEGGIFYTRFFDLLADATGNTVFVHLRKTITTVLREAFPYSRKKLSTIPGSSRAIFMQLRKIGDAIEERKADEARIATIEHINYIEKSLKKALEKI
jgi:GntR family transcriptional regulator, transcriptional repressor for pyruvate dehydrogenase complex